MLSVKVLCKGESRKFFLRANCIKKKKMRELYDGKNEEF